MWIGFGINPFISVNPITAVYKIGYNEKIRNATTNGKVKI
jgi:hypothetical protein